MDIDSKRHLFYHPPHSFLSRVALSLLVGALSALACYLAIKAYPSHARDFAPVWFGARALLQGQNPYLLVGPGLEFDWAWHVNYPATAFVAAIPFTPLDEIHANLTFVFLSGLLFTYAITKDGWFRLPALVSFPFISAVSAAQFSPIISAAIGIPVLGFFLAAKPTIGAAVLAAAPRKTWKYAAIGGLVLVFASLVFRPTWIPEWIETVRGNELIVPPILRGGGFLVLLALPNWREARLLLVMSIVPQTGVWYEALPLFWMCRNRNESMVLAMSTSLGWLLQDYLMTARNEVEFNSQVGSMMVAFAYLPCIWMLHRRSEARGIKESLSGNSFVHDRTGRDHVPDFDRGIGENSRR
jgi:hypothetical protein